MGQKDWAEWPIGAAPLLRLRGPDWAVPDEATIGRPSGAVWQAPGALRRP